MKLVVLQDWLERLACLVGAHDWRRYLGGRYAHRGLTACRRCGKLKRT